MADEVSAGTVAVVEELVISPPANKTLPTSAATEGSPVVGLATLESVSFPLGKIVTGVEATWFRGGSPGEVYFFLPPARALSVQVA